MRCSRRSMADLYSALSSALQYHENERPKTCAHWCSINTMIDQSLSFSGESAASATASDAAEEYFDLEDLGRLRRNVRRAIENVQRERELYHEIILQYLEVCSPPRPFLLPPCLLAAGFWV